MTPEVYYHNIRVKPEHIDELNHVNNVVYLQWVQDAAFAHWLTKAPDSVRERFNWVVLKHEIEYKSPAFLDDELVAKTWVQEYSGVKSVRVVQTSRKTDNFCVLTPGVSSLHRNQKLILETISKIDFSGASSI